jgi:uncharacterized membrane protein YhaH (DUF805 family)
MDNIVRLYTSTDGRISRKSWWLGVLGIVVVSIVISLIILPLLGVSMMPDIAAMMQSGGDIDTAALAERMTAAMRTAGWVNLVMFVIFAYPMYAIGVKRRHDKDNNGMDVVVYLVLTAIVLLIQALGIGMETMTIGEMTIPTTAMWLNLLLFALGIFAIYLLVVLGFLKGTDGANQYGPDPLGGSAVAAA